jgi:hypothetical protein
VKNVCHTVTDTINMHLNILHHEIITIQLGLLKCISFALWICVGKKDLRVHTAEICLFTVHYGIWGSGFVIFKSDSREKWVIIFTPRPLFLSLNRQMPICYQGEVILWFYVTGRKLRYWHTLNDRKWRDCGPYREWKREKTVLFKGAVSCWD